MKRVRALVLNHAGVVAGIPAAVAVLAVVVSALALLSLRQPLSDLILWPAIAAFVVSGWILATRRPANAVGWLLLMTGVGLSFLPWTVLSSWLLVHHVAAAKWPAGVAQGSFVLDVGGLALLLPLLFPDGSLPSSKRRWRVVLCADLGYMVLAAFNVFEVGPIDLPGYHKIPNPFGWPQGKHVVSVLIALCAPLLLLGFIGSFAALVVRWRGADPARRSQMKWVIVSLVIAPVPFILHDWWLWASNTLMTFALPLVPICVAVSVLRYRLYDIDRILSRTVTYLLVTGLLVGIYVGAVAVTDGVIGFSSSFAVAASTLAAAALFQPLRRRVQHGVDRRFNRERYDAVRTVDVFAVRLRDQVDPDVVRAELLNVTAKAVAPARMSLWVAP